jgi:hypothetical protein
VCLFTQIGRFEWVKPNKCIWYYIQRADSGDGLRRGVALQTDCRTYQNPIAA